MSRRYAVIVGARPNFVKAAALYSEAPKHPDVELLLVHTGQHFDDNMSRVFFEEMNLPRPTLQLEVKGEFHTEKIGRMFSSLSEALPKLDALDGVIAFGDVNSSLAAALAAMKDKLPLIHIEAGLRSHDRRMPEEINRAILDHLSSLLFTSEPSGKVNLLKEGISEVSITEVGNLMIQSLEMFRDRFRATGTIEKLGLAQGQYYIATIHRQENIDDPNVLKQILELLERISQKTDVLLPLHPGTAKRIESSGLNTHLKDLHVVEPLGYFEFMDVLTGSRGILTDSGGIQEETSHLGIPCVTLRDSTERPITVEVGSNMLVPPADLNTSEVFDSVLAHLDRTDFKKGHIPLWDKNVSARIFTKL